MATTNTNCRNCDQPISGDYCMHCGQRASVHKVTFKETWQDFWDLVFSVNAPLVSTLKLLFINPGVLFRGYLEGKRKRYYKPVAFFLLVTLIHVLIRSFIGYDALAHLESREDSGIDMTKMMEAGHFMFENINNLLFFFVFALGLLLKAFFYKRNTLAEFIAVSFYLVGVYILIGTLNLFFMNYVNGQVQYLAILVMLIYISYAMVSWFRRPVFGIIVKTTLAYFAAFLVYTFFAFGLSYLIISIF